MDAGLVGLPERASWTGTHAVVVGCPRVGSLAAGRLPVAARGQPAASD